MKTLKTLALALFALVGATTAANAATAFLATDDFVGISFWLISMGMLAATAFFFMEQANVGTQWRKSVNVAGLVTGIAFIHYMYMRAVWVETGDTPTVYRYIDWLITVPLQLIEFYLILAAVKKVPTGIFWRILMGSLVMLVGGYCGEAGFIAPMLGFIIGMIGWAVIIWEIFRGEASQAASSNQSVSAAFNAMRLIVLVGWAIYPLGYVFGLMMETVDINTLNWVYNLADFVNKILFGLIIWNAAVKDTA